MPIERVKRLTSNVKRSGFTLVELLVGMTILGLISAGTLLFLSTMFRGSNQANIVSSIKQNGQVVLDSIDRQIRNAAEVAVISPPAGSSNAIRLSATGGSFIYLACFNTVVSGTPANGWIGLVTSNSATAPATYIPLTNRDAVSGVDVDCSKPAFTVIGSPSDSAPQVVQVHFTLNQGVSAPSRVDFKANLDFRTLISLRTYN